MIDTRTSIRKSKKEKQVNIYDITLFMDCFLRRNDSILYYFAE